MMSLKSTFLFSLLLALSLYAKAEKFSVTGVIKDQGTRQPIELASVYINETAMGGYSNEKGFFLFRSINEGAYHFRFTYLGYETVDTLVTVDKNVNLTIYLVEP